MLINRTKSHTDSSLEGASAIQPEGKINLLVLRDQRLSLEVISQTDEKVKKQPSVRLALCLSSISGRLSLFFLSSSASLPLESFHLFTRRHEASSVEKVPTLVEAVQVGSAFLPVQLQCLSPRGHFAISPKGKKRLYM